jgi:hypothetical protein
MDSKLYEEVCRRFIAREVGVPLDSVTSPRIPNPQRPNLPKYAHQIDLCWEVENKVALYLHIANAKWRASEKIDLPDLLLLQAVRQKVAAHKALLIASTQFTSGAIAAAKDDGIGLHVVRPDFDCAGFPTSDRAAMQAALSEVNGELYTHEVVHRGLDFGARPEAIAPAPRPVPGYTTRLMTSYTTREGPGPGATNRSLGGGSSSGGGGIITRDGGGGGFERR